LPRRAGLENVDHLADVVEQRQRGRLVRVVELGDDEEAAHEKQRAVLQSLLGDRRVQRQGARADFAEQRKAEAVAPAERRSDCFDDRGDVEEEVDGQRQQPYVGRFEMHVREALHEQHEGAVGEALFQSRVR
jgi:hypothetical protein